MGRFIDLRANKLFIQLHLSISALTHITRICHDFDVANLQ